MLRYFRSDALSHYPRLRDTMFCDRALQFRQRLGWAVAVDDNGWERDQYDLLDPLYVIWERPDGTHGGSMRFLPTTGRIMVNEHFAHLAPGGAVNDPLIWECTRFCLAPDAAPTVSAALLLGGAELGIGYGLRRAVGVFDARMVRIYRLLGWAPEIVALEGEGRAAIGLGFWDFSEQVRQRMADRSGLSPELSRHWFRRAELPSVAAA